MYIFVIANFLFWALQLQICLPLAPPGQILIFIFIFVFFIFVSMFIFVIANFLFWALQLANLLAISRTWPNIGVVAKHPEALSITIKASAIEHIFVVLTFLGKCWNLFFYRRPDLRRLLPFSFQLFLSCQKLILCKIRHSGHTTASGLIRGTRQRPRIKDSPR